MREYSSTKIATRGSPTANIKKNQYFFFFSSYYFLQLVSQLVFKDIKTLT